MSIKDCSLDGDVISILHKYDYNQGDDDVLRFVGKDFNST